jgi:hypothetical protein
VRRIRSLMRRVGPLPTRFEGQLSDRLMQDLETDAVVSLMPGLCGPGRLPAARGRAVALRVEPPVYRRLAPDGLPSLTQHGQAGKAGGDTRRPFPVPGDRGPCFLHAARERGSMLFVNVARLSLARTLSSI